MIEDLTKEKLSEYGFDESSIERLFTWEKYECNLINNKGYFFASNIENKIYSGIEGKEKQFTQSLLPQHHKEPKEQFETFQELFKYAVLVGSIERPSNPFLYSNKESQYNWGFNVWLQNYKNWNYGDGAAYKLLLTRTTWIEYLAYCEKEQKELEQRAKELKEKWQLSINQNMTELNAKKLENENKWQEKREKDCERFIDKNYTYSPNLEDFKEKAQIIKLQSKPEYLVFLRTAKETYANAKYFYGTWGDKFKYDIPTYKICESILNFASDEIKNELPKTEKKETEKGEEKFVNTFDYSNIKNYFFSDKIEQLKLIENEMITKSYFTTKGEWNIEKKTLVAFIHILKQLEYLRPKIKGKNEKTSLLAYRRFFETRYKTKISEEMKPSKFNTGTLKNYNPDFLFIPEIEKI